MTTSDFKYYNFSLSRDILETYTSNTVAERKYLKKQGKLKGYESALTNCIITAIASNKVEFDITNQDMINTVEKLIKECGYGTDGIYSENAHIAMQKLCIARGQKPDAVKLYDHTWSARFKRGASKVKSLFGFGKNKEEKKEEPKKVIPQQPEHKNRKTLWGTIVLSAALVGMTTLFCNKCVNENKNTDDNNPKKRIVNVQNTPANTLKIETKKEAEKIPQKTVTENNQQLQAINNFCDSSLDILMGAKKRDALYDKIQQQVDRGIFKIPNGMSVQRIAHAMKMSRIYEGESIILDALNNNIKLTEAQQIAFEKHIDGIGIRGEKLQKRMMQKQKLSNHSKFDKSSYAQQKAHVKNLKQLRQLRGR